MTQFPNNMFFDAFKQYADKDAYNNFFKNFNMNNFDAGNFTEMMQKNLDAMVKAGQISSENVQAIMRRVGEVAQRQYGEAVEATRDFMSSSNPEQALQKQQQYLKSATTNAINNSKEMFEMGAKSMMEVYDIFSRRYQENVDAAVQAQPKKAK